MNIDSILSLLALDYADFVDFSQLKNLSSGQFAAGTLASKFTSELQDVINSMSEDELAVFDGDGNDKLDLGELEELVSFILAQGKISDEILSEDLLPQTDDEVLELSSDGETATGTDLDINDETPTTVDLGTNPEVPAGADLGTNPQTDEEKLRIYNEKLEHANNLINSDETIPDDLITQRNETEAELAEISEQIEKLNLNLANLTAEELVQLETLKARKEELITKRDDIEKQILAVCSEDTKQAILEMQEARNNLNTAAPQPQPADPVVTVPPAENSPVVSEPAPVNTVGGGGGNSTGGITSGGGGGGGGGDKQTVASGGYDNMSVEELNAELTKANSDLSQKQTTLSKILDGSDSVLSGLKTTMNEFYNQYQDILKTVAPELAEKLDGAKTLLDAKQSEIDSKNLEISNQNLEISKCKTSYNNATSTVGEYESIVSSLESAYSQSDNDQDRSEITAKLSSAKTALQNAKEQQTAAQEAWDNAQEQLTTMKSQLETLNSEKTELETQMTNVQAEITALNNEDINKAMSDYNTAKEQYESKKQTMTTDAQSDVSEAQDIVNEIQTALNTKNNEAARSELSFSSLGGTYMLNGVEYTSLLDSSQLQALSSKIQAGGAGNKWGHPDKCLSFAYSYGLWVDGSTNTPIGGKAAEYPDAGAYREISGSQGNMLAEVKRQLDAGIPVVLQVNGNRAGDSRHYVTVVGYRAGAGSTITQNDLLILDTYDGLIEGMGSRGSRFMISGKNTGRTYDYQLYVRKS